MSYKFKPKNQTAPESIEVSSAETLGLISLEPRILLDAAGFVTGAEVAMEAMAAEGSDLGVQVIFENEVAAEPAGDPWLGEVAFEPAGGPWLGEAAFEPAGGPWLGEVAFEPAGGPWL